MFKTIGDKQITNQDQVKNKGLHLLTVCNMESPRAKRLEAIIELIIAKKNFLLKTGQLTKERHKKLWLEYHWFLDQLNKRFKVRQYALENVTVTVGRSVLAQRLSGTTTYTGIVNYCALGDSAASPVVSNTTLGNETYRKALSPSTYTNNIAYLETFFSSTDTDGTFEEYGFFIDGDGNPDTGQLFNRFTQTVVKSNVESLNVQSTITINDA